jgi:hypothetical protein
LHVCNNNKVQQSSSSSSSNSSSSKNTVGEIAEWLQAADGKLTTERTMTITKMKPTTNTNEHADTAGVEVWSLHLKLTQFGFPEQRLGMTLSPSSLMNESRIVYTSTNKNIRTDLHCRKDDECEGDMRKTVEGTVTHTSLKVDSKSQAMHMQQFAIKVSHNTIQRQNAANLDAKRCD